MEKDSSPITITIPSPPRPEKLSSIASNRSDMLVEVHTSEKEDAQFEKQLQGMAPRLFPDCSYPDRHFPDPQFSRHSKK